MVSDRYGSMDRIPAQLLAVWDKAMDDPQGKQELKFETVSQARSTQTRLYLVRKALFHMLETGRDNYASMRDAEGDDLSCYEILLRGNKLIVQKAGWLRGLPKAEVLTREVVEERVREMRDAEPREAKPDPIADYLAKPREEGERAKELVAREADVGRAIARKLGVGFNEEDEG